MFRKLLPRKDVFFRHMESCAAKAVEITAAFKGLVGHMDEAPSRVPAIRGIEHGADEILHGILLELQRAFITPLDRNEISTICRRLDDIVDLVEGAAQRILYYELRASPAPLRALVDTLEAEVAKVQQAVGCLSDLKRGDEIRALLIEIHTLENQADAILRPAIGDLFKQHTDARDIIKWKEVYEHLETATDRCEDVADQIENILLEYA